MTDFSCIPITVQKLKPINRSAPTFQTVHQFDDYEILNDSIQIIKQGYLRKKSEYLSIPRKRWMVLHGIKLYSFKDKEWFYPTEIFDLTEYDNIQYSERTKSFKLISKISTKSRQFIASNIDEMYDWIKFIMSIQLTYTPLFIYAKQNKWYSANKYNLYIKYDPLLTLLQIINYIIKQMENNNEYYPQKLWICQIQSCSFTKKSFSKYQKRGGLDPDLLNKSITNWDINNIKTKGLYLIFANIFVHEVSNLKITCPNMNKINTNNPLKCPIYSKMIHSKSKNGYNEQNLYHLKEYIHFTNEYVQKPKCKFLQNCICYKRMEQNKYMFSDICHLKLYKHPPKSDKIIRQWQQNIKQLFLETNAEENNGIYPKMKHVSSLQSNIYGLINEVIINGFESDLFYNKSDYIHKHISILDSINEKYNCFRHKSMGKPLNKVELLALFLYTNCKCSYNLCESQRNNNYLKWKVFDYYLFQAIYKLNKIEMGKYKIYSGLNHIEMGQKQLTNCYFTTYTSMTYCKDIILSFIGDYGMLIQMDKNTRNNIICCDISWISKFSDECEILIARSINKYPQSFNCNVINNNNKINGIQIVNVTNTFNNKSDMKRYFKKQRKHVSNIDNVDTELKKPYGQLRILNHELGRRYNGFLPLDNNNYQAYDYYV